MDCKKIDEYINLYIDKMLGKEETEELLSHISSCKRCGKELDYALKLKNAMSGMGDIEPPAGLAMSAIKKARKRRYPVFIYASAGVAAVLAVVLIFSSSFINNDYSATRAPEMKQNVALAPAPAASSAPEEAFSAAAGAAAPQASTAPEATSAPEVADSSDNAKDMIMATRAEPYVYTVDKTKWVEFRPMLEDFLNRNKINYQTATDDYDMFSFIIPEKNLEELISLVSKEGIPHTGDPLPGNEVEFTAKIKP